MSHKLKTYFVWSPEREIEFNDASTVYAHTHDEAATVAVREWDENGKGNNKGVIQSRCDVFVRLEDNVGDKPQMFRVRAEQIIEYTARVINPEPQS